MYRILSIALVCVAFLACNKKTNLEKNSKLNMLNTNISIFKKTNSIPDNNVSIWKKEGYKYFNFYDNKWVDIPLIQNETIENKNSALEDLNDSHLIYATDYGVDTKKNDNSNQLQVAINDCVKQDKILVIPNGIIFCKNVKLSCSIIGSGNSILKLIPQSKSCLIKLDSKKKIEIKNITFDGNRSQQREIPLLENYEGLAKFSLIQIQEGFNNLYFLNCIFKNSIQGAIAAQDKGKTLSQGNLTIKNCLFENLRTEGIRYYRNNKALLDNSIQKFKGNFIIKNSSFINIGIRLNRKINSKKNYGNAIASGYVSKLEVTNCNFSETARFDIKTGVIDEIFIKSNLSYNAGWGHVQTQTHPIGKSYNVAKPIYIANNYFISNELVGNPMFFQGKGSMGKKKNHSVYSYVNIENNRLLFLNRKNTDLGDGIQITSAGKYKNITVKNNFCYGIRRGFVGISLPLLDQFKIENITLMNNKVIGRGKSGTTANSLIYTQSPLGGKEIQNLNIINNNVSQTQSSLFFEKNPVRNLKVVDNIFKDLFKYSIYFKDGSSRMIKKEFKGNNMSGKIFDKKD